MELKKILLSIFFVGLISSVKADIIKPAENLSAYDVIKIQLDALKNNDDKDNGIKQTWLFAHPENKKMTGPYPRFRIMLYDVHRYTANIAISYRSYFKTAAALRFYVYASVEVVSTQFRESSTQY